MPLVKIPLSKKAKQSAHYISFFATSEKKEALSILFDQKA
jgi:hypothetical protein